MRAIKTAALLSIALATCLHAQRGLDQAAAAQATAQQQADRKSVV